MPDLPSKTFVLDNGGYAAKAGFATDSNPKYDFFNILQLFFYTFAFIQHLCRTRKLGWHLFCNKFKCNLLLLMVEM